MKLRFYALLLSVFLFTEIEAQDFGTALNFDGVNDYVALPAGTSFNTQNFTFEAWVRWDGPYSNWQRIFDFGSSTSNYMFLTPQNSVNGKPRFAIKTTATSEQVIDGNASMTDGVWHHIAITLDDASDTGKMYIDGILVGSNTAITLRPLDLGSTTNNWIGRSQFSADPYFNGVIDEVRIWSTSQSLTEIQSSLSKILVGNESGLLANYNFDYKDLATLAVSQGDNRVGECTGFYFNQVKTFNGSPNYSDNTTSVNYSWSTNSPVPGFINVDNFTVRWQGEINPSFSQTYTFYTVTDDGVRLWINDQLIIDKWVDQGPTEWTGQITLTAGQWYSIKMEYYEATGGASASLSWSSTSQVKQVIPFNQAPSLKDKSFNLRHGKYYFFSKQGKTSNFVPAFETPIFPLNFLVAKSDFGNALDYDGVDDFVRVPVDTLRETANGFTIETWVKWKTGSGPIFYVGRDWSDYFILDESGLRTYGTNYNGGKAWSIPMNRTIDNNWHHLAVTVDKLKNEGKIYLDGVVSGSFPNNINIGKPLATQVWSLRDLQNQLTYSTLGRNEFYSTYANIQLDEFRIWNYARSAFEINLTKTIPLSGNEPGLIYYVDNNEGIPSGDNRSIKFLSDKVANTQLEIFGFAKTGSSSNFVRSQLPQKGNYPIITKVFPTSATVGNEVTIYGANFGPSSSYNKVLFGTKETPIISVSPNAIKVKVPDGINSLQKVSVINSNGKSNLLDFTVISSLSLRDFTFTQKEIYSQLLKPQSVAVADMNDDNLMDIIIGGSGPLQILYNSVEGNYTASAISTSSSFDYISAAEMDNDGDLDIICLEGSNLILFKNQNGSWQKNTIAGSITGDLLLADMDSDGNLDIVTKNAGRKLGWLKNNGSGLFPGGFITIDNSKEMVSIYAGELNGDNNIDIVAVEEGPGQSYYKVFRYINNGSGSFMGYLVGDGTPYGDAVTIGDFDNDGRNDILHNGYQGFQPTIFYNAGNNIFQKVDINASNGSRVTQMDPADMNGDGLLDFSLSRNDASDQINWFINKGRYNNPNFTRQLVSNNVFSAMDVRALDVDNDGDLDLVSASADDNRIALYLHLFSNNDFELFGLDDQVAGSSTSINTITHSVDITVNNKAILSKLVPAFSSSLKSIVSVGNIIQVSGVTSNDFSDPGNAVIYTITAEDGSKQNWTVSVHPLPAIPVLNTITSVMQTGATVSWTKGSFTDSGLLDISTDNFVTFVAGYQKKLVSANNEVITGLEPGKQYQVRVAGKNAYGESDGFSNVITLITLPSASEITGVTSITQTAATVAWKAVGGATSYQIDLSKDNFSTFVQPYNNFNVLSNNVVLSGLTPGTEYKLRLRTANQSGAAPNFVEASFVTIPTAPAVRDATLKTSTSFVANWDNVATATGYTVDLSDDGFITILKDGETITNSFSFSGLNLGKTYTYRVRAYNSSGISDNSNAMIVVPAYSVAISDQTFNATSLSASIVATSAAGIDSVKVFYRGIASGDYKFKNVPVKSGTTYEATIDAAMMDEMGTEYYFQVKDGLGDKRIGPVNYYYKQLSQVTNPEIPLPKSGRGAGNYNFFSIPYVLEDQNIQNVFEPVMGAYDNTKWRLVHYQDGKNVDYGSGLVKLEPGKGYWFGSLDAVKISLSKGAVVTANRQQDYVLNLSRGWNQIGNPFPFNVSWADVLQFNTGLTGVGSLYVFDGGGFKKGDLTTSGGGFVKSERDVAVKIPVVVKRNSSGRFLNQEINTTDLTSSEWLLTLTLEQGAIINPLPGIGMHPDASSGNDEFDEQTLPRFIDYIELNSYHPEYFLPRFMRDVVPTKTSYNWNYVLESNETESTVTLRWNAQALGVNDAQLWLIDMDGRQLVNMKDRSSYTLEYKGQRNLRFSFAIDKNHFQPDLEMAGLPYPNPFTNDLTIPYLTQQENSIVECVLYDLLGKEVKSIRINSGDVGYHELKWDGTDNRGFRVAPGLYLYRIIFSNSHSQMGRVTLN